jgi:hypothetical protein
MELDSKKTELEDRERELKDALICEIWLGS